MNRTAKILLIFALFAGILLEASVTSMPLVITILILWLILSKDSGVFFLAFVCGILLDTLLVRKIGVSSSYFVIVLFIIVLYEKKFEIQTVPFVLLSSFLGSLGYLLIMHQQYVLQQALLCSFLSALVFNRIVISQRESVT